MTPLHCRPVALAVLAAMGVSACAKLPVPEAAPYRDPLPSTWQAPTNGSGIDEQWWNRFGDPRLSALVTEAVGENPRVFQAEARAAQARAQAVIAGADRLPGIGAGFDASRRVSRNGPLPTTDTSSRGLNLNVNWEIDLWGRLAAQREASREDYLASNEALRALRQSIAAQTAKSYFGTVELRQQVKIKTRTLANITETTRQVSNRADAGVAAPNDKFLSIANRESAKAGLAGNLESLGRATRQLEILIRDYPNGTVRTADALPAVPPSPPAGLPSELLLRRPDVLAAEQRFRAASLRTFAAEKSLLPSISLTGSLGTTGADIGDLLDGQGLLWSIAGQLVQPIFQGGRLRANIRASEAGEREALEAYAEVVLQAFAEVETALNTDGLLRTREQALCSAAQAAGSAERVSTNRYRQGVDPFLTVLESQQRVLDSQGACIAARRAILDNRVDLHLALGGGFGTAIEPIPQPYPLSAIQRVIQ